MIQKILKPALRFLEQMLRGEENLDREEKVLDYQKAFTWKNSVSLEALSLQSREEKRLVRF
jgi:hypothetical protein